MDAGRFRSCWWNKLAKMFRVNSQRINTECLTSNLWKKRGNKENLMISIKDRKGNLKKARKITANRNTNGDGSSRFKYMRNAINTQSKCSCEMRQQSLNPVLKLSQRNHRNDSFWVSPHTRWWQVQSETQVPQSCPFRWPTGHTSRNCQKHGRREIVSVLHFARSFNFHLSQWNSCLI